MKVETSKPLVFVYGTLKRGFYNYDTYLKSAVDQGNASVISDGQTMSKYRLVVGHERNIPFLLANDKEGSNSSKNHKHITGEIYAIQKESVMQGLDLLEGVQSGFYHRECISVQGLDGYGTMYDCWVYFKTDIEDYLLELSTHSSFTEEMGLRYLPKAEVDKTILKLMHDEN